MRAMDQALLVEADRLVASLSPGRRETVRKIVHDAARRGSVSDGAQRFLRSATGSTLVAEVLERNREEIRRRAGRGIEVRRIAVRNVERVRPLVDESVAVTDDPYEVVLDPEIDIVAELIGGPLEEMTEVVPGW